MRIGMGRCDPTPRRAHQKALLDQIRLHHIFQRISGLCESRAQRIDPDRAAAEHLAKRAKITFILRIQPQMIDTEFDQGRVRAFCVDHRKSGMLRQVANTAK